MPTRDVPVMPIALADPFEMSMMRPLMNGPRSLTRTMTERPLRSFTTLRRVPKANVRCAAVRPFGLNRSPFAVLAPDPYQEAIPLCSAEPWCLTAADFDGPRTGVEREPA